MPNCKALEQEHEKAVKRLRSNESELARLVTELENLKHQASPDREKIDKTQQAVDSKSDQLNIALNDVDEIANDLHRCEQGLPINDPP